MENIAVIILVFLSLIITYQIILSIRSDHVFDYRSRVLDESYKESVKKIEEGTERKYNKLPSYEIMVRYFWIPLNNNNWLGFTTLKDYYKRKK